MSSDIAVGTSTPLWVSWSCRRCGHSGGVARTTFPMSGADEAMVRQLLAESRPHVVRIHARSGCIASPDDIRIERYVPTDRSKAVVGTV